MVGRRYVLLFFALPIGLCGLWWLRINDYPYAERPDS